MDTVQGWFVYIIEKGEMRGGVKCPDVRKDNRDESRHQVTNLGYSEFTRRRTHCHNLCTLVASKTNLFCKFVS